MKKKNKSCDDKSLNNLGKKIEINNKEPWEGVKNLFQQRGKEDDN